MGEAVADVIDNSIDVGATEINILYEMDKIQRYNYNIHTHHLELFFAKVLDPC